MKFSHIVYKLNKIILNKKYIYLQRFTAFVLFFDDVIIKPWQPYFFLSMNFVPSWTTFILNFKSLA